MQQSFRFLFYFKTIYNDLTVDDKHIVQRHVNKHCQQQHHQQKLVLYEKQIQISMKTEENLIWPL